MTAALPAPIVDRLAELVMARTGFRRDAIRPGAVARAVEELLGPGEEPLQLLHRAEAGDQALLERLVNEVLVTETYFFRHPEQFAYLAGEAIPSLRARGVAWVRAWSAGCATGEEAYSVAACLLSCLGTATTSPGIEVIGTDLLPENVACAAKGIYGAWSMRGLPQLHPVLKPAGGGQAEVLPQVKRVTRFQRHNLLDPPGALGDFDLIFCRNVLVYFDDQSAARVCDHLAAALAPGGALFFSAMDCRSVPPSLVKASDAELAIYHKPLDPALRRPAAVRSAPRPSPQPPRAAQRPLHASSPAPAPVAPARPRQPPHLALHLEALLALEAGDLRRSERLLTELADLAPDYVPGLLERALLSARLGRSSAAAKLMNELLQRIDARDAQEPVEGPEVLPVAYYRATATAFLEGASGEDERTR